MNEKGKTLSDEAMFRIAVSILWVGVYDERSGEFMIGAASLDQALRRQLAVKVYFDGKTNDESLKQAHRRVFGANAGC